MKKQKIVILMLGVLLCCGGLAQATLVWINNVEIIPSHPLECAKKAVEMAIERDEKTAIQWLKEQTQSNC